MPLLAIRVPDPGSPRSTQHDRCSSLLFTGLPGKKPVRALTFLIHSIDPTTAEWYNPVNITDVTGSMTHAKGLTDVWTDTVVAIGAYWRAQKVLAAITPTTSGTTQTWTWTLPPHFPAGKFLRVTVGGGTLSQSGGPLTWNDHGYYEIALDAGSLTLAP